MCGNCKGRESNAGRGNDEARKKLGGTDRIVIASVAATTAATTAVAVAVVVATAVVLFLCACFGCSLAVLPRPEHKQLQFTAC